jgi:hypothetical protein
VSALTGSVQIESAPSRGSHSSQPLPSLAAAAATATRREVADGELRDEIAAALRDEDDWPSGWTGVRVRPVRHAGAGAGLAALLGGLV